MEILLPALLFLAVLACPLMMVGMGVVAWIWARAHGEKKDLSMGCMGMGGKCDHAEHQNQGQQGQETALQEQVARLQAEVDTLRRPSGATTAAASSDRSSSNRSARTAD
jgi:hypothetical protein